MSPSDRFYKFMQKVLSIFEVLLLAVVKAWLNTQVGQGFLKRIVNWMVDRLYDEVARPILEIILVRVGYSYDVREGKILIERLRKAEEGRDADSYNSTVDDILN